MTQGSFLLTVILKSSHKLRFYRIQRLEDILFIYAKNNLAVVNIYIKAGPA